MVDRLELLGTGLPLFERTRHFVGADVADARAKAYEGVAMISFPGAQWRRDIAAGR